MVQVINRWPEMAVRLRPAGHEGLKTVGHTMVGNIVSNAPVLSGFMASNVYLSATDESTYGSGSGPPTDDVYLLEEVRPDSDMQVIVGAAASYSIFVDLGHHTRGGGSFVPANPFFDRGVEQTAGEFEAIMAEAIGAALS